MAAGALLGFLAAGGCQEQLTAPGACPTSCPDATPRVIDTTLTAVPSGDSTFTGYVLAGAGSALLVSDQLPGGDARAVVRFAPRQDSLLVQDTLRSFVVDSVVIGLGVVGRDSLASGAVLFLYRLPATVDSSVGFTQLDSLFVATNVVDSIVIPDSLQSGGVSVAFSGTELARVDIPAGDSGVLALGVGLTSPSPTGVRIGSQSAGSLAPTFTSFVTIDIADTSLQVQSIGRGPTFNTFVTETAGFPPADLLAVGGAPSARSLIRFALPKRLEDSVQIVRATLLLAPESIAGVANDQGVLEVRALQADVGAKSPLCRVGLACGSGAILRASRADLIGGSTARLEIEVIDIVRSWQGERGGPSGFFLLLLPEASTFTRAVFGSTRAGGTPPRLQLTYVDPVLFEVP